MPWTDLVAEPEDESAAVTAQFRQLGLGRAVYSYLDTCKQRWTTALFNVAVMGGRGAGKTSLIRAIVGEDASCTAMHGGGSVYEQPGYRYADPRYPLVTFWDLPSDRANCENYLEKNYIETFDLLVIVSNSNFDRDTAWLTQQIKLRGKAFFLVLTNVEKVIGNLHEAESSADDSIHPDYVDVGEEEAGGGSASRSQTAQLENKSTLAMNQLVGELRQMLETDLLHLGMPEGGGGRSHELFVVDSLKPACYDFPELAGRIYEISKDAAGRFSFKIKVHMIGHLRYLFYKHEARISDIAFSAARSSAVTLPIPGTSAAVDTLLLISQMIVYMQEFGLSRHSVAALEELLESPPGSIEVRVSNELEESSRLLLHIRNLITPENIATKSAMEVLSSVRTEDQEGLQSALLSELGLIAAASDGLSHSARLVLPPGLGTGVAAVTAFVTVTYELRRALIAIHKVGYDALLEDTEDCRDKPSSTMQFYQTHFRQRFRTLAHDYTAPMRASVRALWPPAPADTQAGEEKRDRSCDVLPQTKPPEM